MVFIHSFTARDPDPNFADFTRFLSEVPPVNEGGLSRSVNMGVKREVPAFFGWVADRPRVLE